jgi:hypothetical protein
MLALADHGTSPDGPDDPAMVLKRCDRPGDIDLSENCHRPEVRPGSMIVRQIFQTGCHPSSVSPPALPPPSWEVTGDTKRPAGTLKAMDAPETLQVTPEARAAALDRLRELFGGEPDSAMLQLAEERDRAFEARLTHAQ